MSKPSQRSFFLCGTFGKREMIIDSKGKLGLLCRYNMRCQHISTPTRLHGENLN
jgi:hypothetical protein